MIRGKGDRSKCSHVPVITPNIYLINSKMSKEEGRSVSQNAQKILAGRRIAIPKEMFEKSNLKDGEIVIVEQSEDGIITIIPAEVRRKIPA